MRILLTSGAYSAQSLIADAQKCRNLYPEKNPAETSPAMPVTHYPRPGQTLLSQPPTVGFGRCLYSANNGDVYAVVGQNLYYIDPNFQWNFIGALLAVANTPVSIADNGQMAIVVDNSGEGYTVNFEASRAFAQIADQNFVGSTRADFLDSFLILNKPGTNKWYSTTSDAITPFNALYVGVKTAWPDNILCVVANERQVFIFGPKKSEPWYNAGGVPFPFQIQPGVIIEQGCAAKYSPAKMDLNVYWLSETVEGDRMVMRINSQNVAERISTHAIEVEWRSYPRVDDAIGSTYQISGHLFYMLHFPTADRTWVFDEATQQWHEDNWIDQNGVFHRARNTFNAFGYGKNLALDWQNGNLYQLDITNPTDNGVPIVWQRSFPHTMNEMKYVSYSAFVADLAIAGNFGAANAPAPTRPWSDGFSNGFGPIAQADGPELLMRMSRNGGYQYGNNRIRSLPTINNYRTLQRFRGLGIARDAVFELSSTAAMVNALNGAYVDILEGSA